MSRVFLTNGTILDHLATAVIVTRNDLSIDYTNEAAELLLGMSFNKIAHKPLTDCFIDSPKLNFIANEAIQKKRPFTEYAIELCTKHIHALNVDCTVTPCDDQHLVFELSPTQERKNIALQENAKNIQEASQLLIQGLAHEIRNPLTGLRGAAQLLQQHNNPTLAPYLDIFIREVDRLDTLLNTTLSSDTASIRMQRINIHQILSHVVSLVQADSQTRFTYDYDPSIPEIFADEQKLTQALLNIIKNASQSMQDCGRVTLSTRIHLVSPDTQIHGKNMLHIQITDQGSGIPGDLQNKVFIPMVTTKAKGTGVGLYITHTIIQKHGGSIRFDSSHEGTVFHIYLPLSYA